MKVYQKLKISQMKNLIKRRRRSVETKEYKTFRDKYNGTQTFKEYIKSC